MPSSNPADGEDDEPKIPREAEKRKRTGKGILGKMQSGKRINEDQRTRGKHKRSRGQQQLEIEYEEEAVRQHH
jgi:hypothetical protein